MQNLNNVAKGIIALGLIITMLALLWWHAFFRSLAQQYDPGLGEHDPTLDTALVCIVYTTSTCANALQAAAADGRYPYDPSLFWLGMGTTLAGAGVGKRQTLIRKRQ